MVEYVIDFDVSGITLERLKFEFLEKFTERSVRHMCRERFEISFGRKFGQNGRLTGLDNG